MNAAKETVAAVEAPGSVGWNTGEAPRDGKSYVIRGRVVWADEYGGGSNPFLAEAHFVHHDGWAGWVDSFNLAISPDIKDTLHIDHWIALPIAQTSEPS